MKIDQILTHFSLADKNQIEELNISLEDLTIQLNHHIHGFPPLNLIKPAILEQGIKKIDKQNQLRYIEIYEKASMVNEICKFVPASGAASRMFRSLFAYLNGPEEKATEEIATFFNRIKKFAFYQSLSESLKKENLNLEELLEKGQYHLILTYLLTEKGLNYGQLPKALLAFHKYENHIRTAAEEHLAEGAAYARYKNDQVKIHFTVSLQHKELIVKHLEEVIPQYEKKFNASFHYEISVQNPSTDTIAVTLKNEPFRDDKGNLVFRPGGHGALLENLNQIDADLIFIKNVDNVVPDQQRASTVFYKKLIGGVLVDYQQQIHDYLNQLNENNHSVSQAELSKIWEFIEKELCAIPPKEILKADQKNQVDYLFQKLNRPIRVVGVISTEGNTGGGPFWVEEKDGTISLQVVETAQIDTHDPKQKVIMEQSRFANITDLVCAVKDFQGKPFDLLKFRDPETGFISQKSQFGRDLKALELPGLWNGSMADWNTIFVEVPGETFSPVKVVLDLLGGGR